MNYGGYSWLQLGYSNTVLDFVYRNSLKSLQYNKLEGHNFTACVNLSHTDKIFKHTAST